MVATVEIGDALACDAGSFSFFGVGAFQPLGGAGTDSGPVTEGWLFVREGPLTSDTQRHERNSRKFSQDAALGRLRRFTTYGQYKCFLLRNPAYRATQTGPHASKTKGTTQPPYAHKRCVNTAQTRCIVG